MDIKIEKAKLEDLNAIMEMGNNTRDFFTADGEDLFWPKDVVATAIASDDAIVLVAKDNNKVVGFIMGGISVSFKKITLENIFVNHDYRKKGIGAKLCKEIVSQAHKKGCIYICALTNKVNKFCEKVGFFRGDKFTWYSYPYNKIDD